LKAINSMNLGELAAYIDTHLRENGINVVLSGGAAVSVHSNHKYVSKDIDFIGRYDINHNKVEEVMADIGFTKKGRYYFHPQTKYFAEFISGPATVGQDPIGDTMEIQLSTGFIRILSPTDSVKDRLAPYYHFKDRQGLEQAVLIAHSNQIDLDNIEAWSIREGKQKEYSEFRDRIAGDY
jgi:hypothetical protein